MNIKSILSAPFKLLFLWLLLAGVYQSYEVYQAAIVKAEQLNRVAAVVKPLGLFSQGDR